MSVYGERIMRLETEVTELRIRAEENKLTNDKQFAEVNQKLDALLTLRDKGIGAFWLASVVVGTGIAGALWAAFNWLIGR